MLLTRSAGLSGRRLGSDTSVDNAVTESGGIVGEILARYSMLLRRAADPAVEETADTS